MLDQSPCRLAASGGSHLAGLLEAEKGCGDLGLGLVHASDDVLLWSGSVRRLEESENLGRDSSDLLVANGLTGLALLGLFSTADLARAIMAGDAAPIAATLRRRSAPPAST